MKTKCLVLLSLLVGVVTSNATLIGQWTFEVNTPADLSNSTASPAVAADVGAGTATGAHASAATDWSTPVGNGSGNSFSANTWAVGDYWQFQVSTLGFQNIMLSWDQTSSSTGPVGFRLDYSTDGSLFATFATYTVRTNGAAVNNAGTGVTTSGFWASANPETGYSYSFDLSSVFALDNQSSIYFRLVMDSSINALGNTVPAGGTDRVDDFTVNGDRISVGVPDTGTTALLLGIPFLTLWTLRRLTARSA